MEKDSDGRVAVEEFSRHLADKKMKAFAASLDVEPYDVLQFFTALSSSGQSGFDLETFVVGCIKLRGYAKSIDLMHLFMAQEKIHDDNEVFKRLCEVQLADIRGKLNV